MGNSRPHWKRTSDSISFKPKPWNRFYWLEERKNVCWIYTTGIFHFIPPGFGNTGVRIGEMNTNEIIHFIYKNQLQFRSLLRRDLNRCGVGIWSLLASDDRRSNQCMNKTIIHFYHKGFTRWKNIFYTYNQGSQSYLRYEGTHTNAPFTQRRRRNIIN